MREIKFRAWDGYEMINDINLGMVVPWEDVVFMQYTGLKDMVGRDVYEGDIINFDPDLYGDNMPQRCVVEWSHYRAGWKVAGGVQGVHFWAFVVGNIYENPELLEK